MYTIFHHTKHTYSCVIRIIPQIITILFVIGDLFGMYEDVLYCRLHFEMMTSYGQGDPIDMCPPLHSPSGKSSLCFTICKHNNNLGS